MRISPKSLIVGVAIATLILILPPFVYAALPSQAKILARNNAAAQSSNISSPSGKLNKEKLSVCEKRQEAIRNRSNKVVERLQRHERQFTLIASRVETYYTKKVLPKGLKVDNYDDLVSNLEAKRSAVNVAIEKVENKIAEFSCSSDNPKGQINEIKAATKEAIRSLKEYKKSIVDLIVAVRSVVGTSNREATRSATKSAE